MTDTPPTNGAPDAAPSPRDQERARRRRNVAIAWGLFAFVALVFVITLVRLKENVAARPF